MVAQLLDVDCFGCMNQSQGEMSFVSIAGDFMNQSQGEMSFVSIAGNFMNQKYDENHL